jgi:hypothetical protein
MNNSKKVSEQFIFLKVEELTALATEANELGLVFDYSPKGKDAKKKLTARAKQLDVPVKEVTTLPSMAKSILTFATNGCRTFGQARLSIKQYDALTNLIEQKKESAEEVNELCAILDI